MAAALSSPAETELESVRLRLTGALFLFKFQQLFTLGSRVYRGNSLFALTSTAFALPYHIGCPLLLALFNGYSESFFLIIDFVTIQCSSSTFGRCFRAKTGGIGLFRFSC